MEHQRDQPIDFMSQHFVAAIVDAHTLDKGKITSRTVAVFSGWLLEVQDTLFWVTAGHCLRDLDQQINDKDVEIVRFLLKDDLGYMAQFPHPVSYPYEPGRAFYVYDQEDGLDFAIIPLKGLYRQNILKNGNVAITRENWIHQKGLEFKFFRILGIPEDCVFNDPKPDGTSVLRMQTVMMAVNQITFQDAIDAKTKHPARSDEWFIGRCDPGTGDQTVVGMSGGPVYGFRYDESGALSYHVVALQSWWDEKQRIVYGCSVPYFAERLNYELERFYKNIHANPRDS